VTASTIVEPFNIEEDIGHGILSGPIDSVMNQLHLERADETFRRRIVVTITPTAP
jgi:hypothetical protein